MPWRLKDSQTDQFSGFAINLVLVWLYKISSLTLHLHVNKAFLQDIVGHIPGSWHVKHSLLSLKWIKHLLFPAEVSLIKQYRMCFSCTVWWLQTHTHRITPFPCTVIGSDNETEPASALALSQQGGPEISQLLMELALLTQWRQFCLWFGTKNEKTDQCNDSKSKI